MNSTTTFTEHRSYLFSIAYRMLGSAADAEDVLQEAYLRWQKVSPSTLESPRAYLSAIVTRLSIDHLRSARVQRETYVGPWLPEPIEALSVEGSRDVVEIDESISMAFLVLLESLSPAERAAFLLREIFEYDYSEIAGILEKSETACRQLVSRARTHIANRRSRFPAPPEERDRLASRFLQACATGDLDGLVATLADDVTLWSDGGGKVASALNPIHGPTRVARFMLGVLSKAPEGFRSRVAVINGQPGVVAFVGDRVRSVLTLDIRDGAIAGVYIVNNPDKLGRLDLGADVTQGEPRPSGAS